MRRGFTLVELSIVLVIIGLIIGGILVSRSMIGTARIQRQVQQIQQFDAAFNNFMTKYNALPGDSSAMGCTSGACDNGSIQDFMNIASQNPNVWGFDLEVADVWVHLQKSGFMQTGPNFVSTITGSFDVKSANRNSPQLAIDPEGGVIVGATNYAEPARRIVYELANFKQLTANGMNIQNYGMPIMTPADALAIDKKMDDGIANTGLTYVPGIDFQGGYNGHDFAGNAMYFGPEATPCNNTGGAKYLIDYKGKGCALVIQVLSQQGGLSF